MKELMSRPGLRRLLAGQTVSAFGDWMATVALMALVLDLTHSSTAVAGVLLLRLAPATVAGPVAARVVGRWNRKHVMLATDLVRVGVVALVPLVRAVWWVYIWAFALEVASLVFLPARDAAIPDLVGDGDLQLANSLVLGSSYGTIPLGAGAFGLIAAFVSTGASASRVAIGVAFWVDAATFLVSFLMIRGIAELDAQPLPDAASAGEPSFRAALRIPLVRDVLPATAAAALGIGALFSLGIVFVRDVLDASNTQFGVLIALFGVGAEAGLGLLSRVGVDDFTALRGAVLGQGVVIASMSMAPTIELTFLGAALFGACAAAALAAGMAFLQRSLADNERTLAFAAFHIVIRGGLALAAIAAGVADDLLSRSRLPLIGDVDATRLVLFFAGLVVLAGAALAAHGPAEGAERHSRPVLGTG